MNDRQDKRADRLQLMLTHDEIELVENWRFRHRMPSRSAAVRALLRIAFENDSAAQDADGMLGVSSGDVGILSTSRRVDRAIGIEDGRPPVLIAAEDAILGHAARSLLSDLDVPLAGPVTSAETLRGAVRARRPAAIVLISGGAADDRAPLAEAVAALAVPVVVVTPAAAAAVLPDALRRAPSLDPGDLVGSLADAVRALAGPGAGGGSGADT